MSQTTGRPASRLVVPTSRLRPLRPSAAILRRSGRVLETASPRTISSGPRGSVKSLCGEWTGGAGIRLALAPPGGRARIGRRRACCRRRAAGTPNHGSEWVRLRIWLELHDQFASLSEREFSLFAALRDGTGEAKIDLRSESDFLRSINARPWPASVPVIVIAARLLPQTETFVDGLDAISDEVGSAPLGARLHEWWSSLGSQIGDGAVSLESTRLPNMASPIIVDASHRTMLHRLFPDDPAPPAIAPILATLGQWSDAGAR